GLSFRCAWPSILAHGRNRFETGSLVQSDEVSVVRLLSKSSWCYRRNSAVHRHFFLELAACDGTTFAIAVSCSFGIQQRTKANGALCAYSSSLPCASGVDSIEPQCGRSTLVTLSAPGCAKSHCH